MAKKKRKKTRRPTTGATTTKPGTITTSTQVEEEEESEPAEARPTGRGKAPAAPVSNRQARKEAARRERERRIKAARRRARIQRVARWGIGLAAIAAIGGFIWWQVTASQRLEGAATAAAAAFDCSDPETPLANAGQGHSPPYAEGQDGIPAASGSHHPNPLPAEPKVYNQPVPEPNAVHNLEHGYVLVYYRAGGEGALPDAAVTPLEGLAEGESEVIMAPYPDLGEDTNLALVSWRRVQTCQVPADADPSDAQALASYFISRFRNELAPEAAAT